MIYIQNCPGGAQKSLVTSMILIRKQSLKVGRYRSQSVLKQLHYNGEG